jgi:hypothetical protein
MSVRLVGHQRGPTASQNTKFDQSWAMVGDYRSESNDLRRYFRSHHEDIATDSFLSGMYWRCLTTQDSEERAELVEFLSPYWIECFRYTDRCGTRRCRVCFVRRDSKLYHINVFYRHLVDYCYKNNYINNSVSLIGPHNYDEIKRWILAHS